MCGNQCPWTNTKRNLPICSKNRELFFSASDVMSSIACRVGATSFVPRRPAVGELHGSGSEISSASSTPKRARVLFPKDHSCRRLSQRQSVFECTNRFPMQNRAQRSIFQHSADRRQRETRIDLFRSSSSRTFLI